MPDITDSTVKMIREALEAFVAIPITAPDGTDWWQTRVSIHSSDLRRAAAALAALDAETKKAPA